MTDRHTLEADLLRYQDSGDFAAQAETLMSLAEIVWQDASDDAENTHTLPQGLYGQAYAAYEKVGNTRGMAQALHEIISCIGHDLEFSEVLSLHAQALQLYKDLNDLNAQAKLYLELGRFQNPDITRWAYEQALICYEGLNDLPNQAHTLRMLNRLADRLSSEALNYAERAISLYRQIGEPASAGDIYLILSHDWRLENYDTARGFLEKAHVLFQEPLHWGLIRTLNDLMALAHHHRDYATYRQSFEEVFAYTTTSDEKLPLWAKLAAAAADCREFAISRYAYQQCVMVTVQQQKSGEAWYYWEWGKMEFFQSGRREMGLALCQWAVTLLQGRFGLPSYQKELSQMRAKAGR